MNRLPLLYVPLPAFRWLFTPSLTGPSHTTSAYERTIAETLRIMANYREQWRTFPVFSRTSQKFFAILSEIASAMPFSVGMPVSHFDLGRLKALQSEPPKTLIALVRRAWPEIKAALDHGHSLKTIHQRLTEAEIRITYIRLSEYVSRLRREEKLGVRSPLNSFKGSQSPANAVVARASTAAASGKRDRGDPLSDYQERAAKNKPFDFEPGPPDESKLI